MKSLNWKELLKISWLKNQCKIDKIQTRPVWELNHRQKPYKDYQAYKIEKAVELIEKTLCIPCSVNLSEENIKRIIKELDNG